MRLSLVSCLLASSLLAPLRADEGMWTFDNVPTQKIKAKYGFEPSQEWLKKLQLATLRFPGGTGSFVSKDGLVITNHHVGRSGIAQVSSASADYIKNGFTAATRDAEIKVPGLELMMLVSMENVTAKVNAGIKPGMNEKDALKVRQNALSTLKQEEDKRTGLNCESVKLYQGGEYWIYRYKKFKDVRLVQAPELQVASFGGDSDNYTYPRWNLDFALFRVYEDGKPYQPEGFLPFSRKALDIGDLTLISGHPGTTFRQLTHAQMAFARDIAIPYRLKSLARQRKALEAFAKTSHEAARISADPIYSIGNGQKRITGQLMGLQKDENMAKVRETEKALRQAVEKDPKLKARTGQSWAKIEKAIQKQKSLLNEICIIDSRNSAKTSDTNLDYTLNSTLLAKALILVRLHTEEAKPSEKRLEEFENGNIKSTKGKLSSPKPIHKDMDEARLVAGLKEAQELLGAKHPFVVAMLGNKTPEVVAQAAIEGTKLHDLEFRKQLMEGGEAALKACQDPMIKLAKILDPFSRKIRKQMEDEVEGLFTEHLGRIAECRFAINGKESYPDATFTLRISYGPVATYATGSGTYAQPFTTFMGLFDRHIGWGRNGAKNGAGAEPYGWTLPQRWLDRRKNINLDTAFNFIYGCDTVGGNSGSPVVNKKGEFVGINFDSVFEGQGGYYIYDDATKRAVAADAQGILESLGKVMDGGHLVKELKGE